MGGITNKYLAKLAEGRTEITTKMICEAEKQELYSSKNTLQYLINEDVQRQWQAIAMSMANAQMMNPYSQYGGLLGGCFEATAFGLCQYHISRRCPYCGK